MNMEKKFFGMFDCDTPPFYLWKFELVKTQRVVINEAFDAAPVFPNVIKE